ncbi:hypothetical protein B6A10_06100 [Flavobacterium sp. L1I52]|uniref:HAD family phosphatase n=1 Tax=Flavobacterium pokkalii TaxID=1940408 RepID=A0ABR7UQQ2_9FLAO|nr:HAD family phosphatase [Flavobacterium pokkalii]MBD0724746.1 hypothetical protein [Flavobacterium pokkalii]
MTKIKAVFFDFDGTLVNSDNFHFNCWNESLKKFNVKLKYHYYLNHLAGIPTSLNAETLIKKYALSITIKDLSTLKDSITKNKIKKEEIKFMPNALAILQRFEKEKISMFLVTGSPRVEVDYILKKIEIEKYFKSSITRNDVTKSKPAPDPYLKAILKSNINPKNIIVFEDTPNGVASAKSANLKCFAIQTNLKLQKKLINADKTFKNFNQAIEYLENKKLI